jgi:hypothetical protein
VAWICMQDPEGNEFCLEQVMPEPAAPPDRD